MSKNDAYKQEMDPETQRILNYFKWSLEPEEFKEWWGIEQQAKKEAQANLWRMATIEKKEWGEVKVFAKEKGEGEK